MAFKWLFKIFLLLVNEPFFLKQSQLAALTGQFAIHLLSKFLSENYEKDEYQNPLILKIQEDLILEKL